MTILKKGLLLIAVPLLFQIVFITIVARSIQNAREAESWALHTKDVIVHAENTFNHLTVAQSAVRGYVLTGAPQFKDSFESNGSTALTATRQLRTMISDNPQQIAQLASVQQSGSDLLNWNRSVVALVDQGQSKDAIELIRSLKGQNLLEDCRRFFDQFLAEENKLEIERTGRLAKSREQQQWVMSGGLFGATLVTCFMAYLFSTSISRRLHRVGRHAEHLAEGLAIEQRIGGSDEVARVDEILYDVSRRLRESADVERAYKAEIEKRATALASANETLRQQTQENEMFVYSVSHDLRSPLVNLQGFSKELVHAGRELREALADERVPAEVRSRITRLMEQDVDDSIRFIQSAVTRSAAIIDALLRLSRAGRVEYRLSAVDLDAVVRRIIDAMANTIESKKAEVGIDGTLGGCWGDATAVEQIFGNLIGNAVNYLDPKRVGSVRIGVADAADGHGPDDALPRADAPDVELKTYYVRDNGLGIPEAYVSKVFLAFQRLHGDVAKGEGIGLALVRRMVERHGGRVWVKSQENAGTTFYVSLPANEPVKPAATDETN